MNATIMQGSSGRQHAAGRVLASCPGALALAAAGRLTACGGSGEGQVTIVIDLP